MNAKINQAKEKTQRDMEDNSLLLVILLLVIQCGLVSYSSLPNPPFPFWFDLVAACIHHCTA